MQQLFGAHPRLSTRAIGRLATLSLAVVWLVSSAWLSPAPARADVQDFSYDSWNVAAEVGLNDEGRAAARITERITAKFPETDQNRGIVRGIPDRYQGAALDLRDISVTNEAGAPVPFELESDEGFTAVLTGDDRFVHGLTTYVIGYTVSDVIIARDDGTADEFYWDLLNFEHAQPVDAFSATVAFDATLAEQLTGDAACYLGAANSSDRCEIASVSDPGSQLPATAVAGWEITPVALGPYEGVTAAIGLKAGSVVQPASRVPTFALDGVPLIVAGSSLALGVGACVAGSRLQRNRKKFRGTIVAQYDVPGWLPPLIAAKLVGVKTDPVPAQIVHLAVRGAIRIESAMNPDGTVPKPKKQRPALRVMDPQLVEDDLDQLTLTKVFKNPVVGDVFTVPKSDEKFAGRMEKLRVAGKKQATERGYLERVHSPGARVAGIVGIVIAVAAITYAVFAVAIRQSPLPAVAVAIGCVGLVVSAFGMWKREVHTPLGAESREYLLGVRDFIRVAEADRIQMLQSYEGAERLRSGDVDVVQLYERLLPYAMLFGFETEWTEALETQYAARQGAGIGASYTPHWIAGYGAAGTMSLNNGLQSTISQFSSTFTSAASYTSSSSGGASGGGFAGGGGGGGFSGGR